MALNMNDPYIRAERQPPSLVTLGVRLKTAYGVGAENYGIKGNQFHTSGFHRSRAFLLKSPLGNGGDYSTHGSRNQGGNENNNAAFDFTPGAWGTSDNTAKMKIITSNVLNAARNYDPRLAAWYEFAGTLDGKNVVTFYARGGEFKDPFDDSHLHHLHGSGYRDTIEVDHSGLADIILGIGEDMSGSFGPTQINVDGYTSLVIPPVQGGTADPRETWLNIGADSDNTDFGLRIWGGNGDGGFFAVGSASGLYTLKSGQVLSLTLPKGLRILTISRTTPFKGSISACFERK